jgi:hypothetical protein
VWATGGAMIGMGGQKNFQKNLSLCHVVRHGSYMGGPRSEAGRLRFGQAANRISHGKVVNISYRP